MAEELRAAVGDPAQRGVARRHGDGAQAVLPGLPQGSAPQAAL